MSPACPFCVIVHEDPHDQIEHEVLNSIIITPLNPVVEGHKLIIPRIHIEDAGWDSEVTGAAFAAAAMYASFQAGDYNLITSAGPAATQTVYHMHIHFVPRAEGDGLHLPWTGQHD
jgi:histidine triad (HIT) family protein